MIFLKLFLKHYDSHKNDDIMKYLNDDTEKALIEIQEGNQFFNEAYLDFHDRYSNSPETKKYLLEQIAADMESGIDSKEVLKRYVYH